MIVSHQVLLWKSFAIKVKKSSVKRKFSVTVQKRGERKILSDIRIACVAALIIFFWVADLT
jgi:hypothetical protein